MKPTNDPASLPAAWIAASDADPRRLDDLLVRLGHRDVVDGILIFGSAASGTASLTGDLDILLVFAEVPASLRLVVTEVDGRLAEFLCTSTAVIDTLGTDARRTTADGWDASALLDWVRQGRIELDRGGRLRRAQQRAVSLVPTAVDLAGTYGRWFKTNYNLRQTRRILATGDPISLMAVDLRLLYGLYDLWVDYFEVRGLPWRGDKEAIRYLAAADPAFLAAIRRCLATADRDDRLALYAHLADRVMEPVGGLWPDGATAVTLHDESTPGAIREALAQWRDLIATAGDTASN